MVAGELVKKSTFSTRAVILQERLTYSLEKRISPARSSCYSDDTNSMRSSGGQQTPPSAASTRAAYDRFVLRSAGTQSVFENRVYRGVFFFLSISDTICANCIRNRTPRVFLPLLVRTAVVAIRRTIDRTTILQFCGRRRITRG